MHRGLTQTWTATPALTLALSLMLTLGIVSNIAAAQDAVAEDTANGRESPDSIVFMLAADTAPELRAALVDALEAQLVAGAHASANAGAASTSAAPTDPRPTPVHWETLADAATDLRAAIEQGTRSARAHNAAGVFWLDASDATEWLLYLMDASAERVLARRMETSAGSAAATIEAVAVIVRESAAALLAGQPIAMDPVARPQATTSTADTTEAPAAPTLTPSAAPSTRSNAQAPAGQPSSAEPLPGPVRFAVAYALTPVTMKRWQHGLSLNVALMFDSGLLVGVGYTLLPALNVHVDDTELSVNRRPIRALVGFALPLSEVVRLDLEGAALLDVASRHAVTDSTSTADDDSTRVIFGGALAVRVSWIPQRSLEVFTTLGVDVFANRFDYAKEQDGRNVVLLAPWPVSPTAELGVAFRP